MVRKPPLSRMVVYIAVIAAMALTAAPGTIAQDTSSGDGDCPDLTREEKIAYARNWTEVALNENRLDEFDAYVAKNVIYDAGLYPGLTSRDELKAVFEHLLATFPGIRFSVEQVVAEGDYVAVRWLGVGPHEGAFLGVAPTGRTVSFTGINMYRFSCGQIVEGWSESDGLELRMQLESDVSELPPDAPGDAASASPESSCETGARSDNVDLALRWLSVWSTKDVSTFDEVAHPDIVHHWAQHDDTTGLDQLKEGVQVFFTGFPDFVLVPQFTIVDGDWVVIHFTVTGTQTGPFLELEPSGARATWTGTNLFRIECGQIVESWSEVDSLGLRSQLAAPQDTATPAAWER